MKTYTTIGRILFGLPFIIFGLFHFLNAEQMGGMVPFPPQTLWVYLSGAGLILAGISILIQKKAKLALRLLALELLIFVAVIHLPAVIGGDQMAMSGLLKDLALAGAALYMVADAKD